MINPQEYQGTFAINELPNIKKCLICNLDPSHMPGSHWIAIYNDIYFDSYGRQLPFKGMKQCITQPVQTLGTSSCGQHSLYFIHQMTNNLPLNYRGSTIWNDKMVTKFICKKYDYHSESIDLNYIISQICTEYRNYHFY